MASRPSIRARGPNTNLKVVAILEKANAIRQVSFLSPCKAFMPGLASGFINENGEHCRPWLVATKMMMVTGVNDA